MALIIRGLGTAIPPTRIGREQSLQLACALGTPSDEQATWIPAMYAGTGIQNRNVWFSNGVLQDALNGTRHTRSTFLPKGTPGDRGPSTSERMKIYADCAAPLIRNAVQIALDQSGLQARQLTHLITVSCTGFRAPGFDVELIDQFHLPCTIERTHVGFMGCHGALNGLRVANAYTTADPEACVLLCALELCSLHYHYGWDPQRMVANALFADGAAAMVATSSKNASVNDWRVIASGSCVFPNSTDAMTWTIGDHGFAMTLSKRVPELIQSGLRPWMASWLNQHQLAVEDIGSWAIHPGGPRIIAAAEEALGLTPDDTAISRAVLADHGNMSSPTVLFILKRMQEKRASRPCVALGFGPGLTAEATLIR